MQNFRPVALMVVEILGLKLNKKQKNWRNGFFAIPPMLVVQILGTHIDLGYHPVVSKVDYH